VLCRDFGVRCRRESPIDLLPLAPINRRSDCSTRVTITRLLGDLRQAGLVQGGRKKIPSFDPVALAKDSAEGWPQQRPQPAPPILDS